MSFASSFAALIAFGGFLVLVGAIQVATPSRERVKAYMDLRDQIELTVGRINGDFSSIGATALTYLHRSFDREEMAVILEKFGFGYGQRADA